jgi:hypothetical protein
MKTEQINGPDFISHLLLSRPPNRFGKLKNAARSSWQSFYHQFPIQTGIEVNNRLMWSEPWMAFSSLKFILSPNPFNELNLKIGFVGSSYQRTPRKSSDDQTFSEFVRWRFASSLKFKISLHMQLCIAWCVCKTVCERKVTKPPKMTD